MNEKIINEKIITKKWKDIITDEWKDNNQGREKRQVYFERSDPHLQEPVESFLHPPCLLLQLGRLCGEAGPEMPQQLQQRHVQRWELVLQLRRQHLCQNKRTSHFTLSTQLEQLWSANFSYNANFCIFFPNLENSFPCLKPIKWVTIQPLKSLKKTH